jgi:hypothetical protein
VKPRLTAIGLLCLVLTACGADGSATGTATGSVVDISGDLTVVESFTIVTGAGECTFVPAEGLTFHGGPLSHLSSHLVSGEPITVDYEAGEGGAKVATEVRDAG